MTTEPTLPSDEWTEADYVNYCIEEGQASRPEPSEADEEAADRAHTEMAARSLVEKAMDAKQVIELTLAFGLKPDQALIDAAEQEAYALDHQAQGACDWS